jgi:catechol 2,3-dioxygenase-like lactoylglutathione lyase family enzyme
LTSITLGVPDVDASRSFFDDFGLATDDGGWMHTRDGGAQLELTPAPHRRLERLGVGAADADDLGRIAARADALGLVAASSDDRLVVTEPATGLAVEVTVADPLTTTATDPTLNSPAHVGRRNVPADSVLADHPVQASNLTHVVYGSTDQPTTLRFFTEVLGFEVSDQVPGIIAFTRCGEVHHNLAIQAAPVPFVHHIAFEMDSIDDVVRGGQHMVEIDPDRHTWGVGRHAIGSNWFWYLREPSGTFVEYTADIDRISAHDLYRPKEWSGHEFLYSFGPPTPQEFMEPTDLPDLIAAAG